MANLINVHTGVIHADINVLANTPVSALFCDPATVVSWDDFVECGAAPITCADCAMLIENIQHVATAA